MLGSWLKASRAVSDWDGSNGRLASFYEWNSRMQITTWAGAYSRREWSGMVDSYYGGRLNVWLNHTLASGVESTAITSSGLFDIGRDNGGGSGPAPTPNPNTGHAGGYDAYANMDCNFGDLRKAKCPASTTLSSAGAGVVTPAECVLWLQAECNKTVDCIGFNYPGTVLFAL